MPSAWGRYCRVDDLCRSKHLAMRQDSSNLMRKKLGRCEVVGNDRCEYDGDNRTNVASSGNTHHQSLLLWWIPAAGQGKRNRKGSTGDTEHCPNSKNARKVDRE